MGSAAENITTISPKISKSTQSTSTFEDIKKRRSPELIIALCGAIGSGVKTLKEHLSLKLTEHGYITKHVTISDLIIEKLDPDREISSLSPCERYTKLQDLGDSLRQSKTKEVLAELAIEQIAALREDEVGDTGTQKNSEHRIAYIINQIKHPGEIELFQELYKNNFYLIGLMRTEDERRRFLKSGDIDDGQASELIKRDRKDKNPYGQQVEKCLHLSDYFIRNIDEAEKIENSVERFIRLIHGTKLITPTKEETGIYAAQSASLRSACLSRQVGAAITDDNGSVLSTGCNDVPTSGGGLYNAESASDKRCYNFEGTCHNDLHKNKLKNEIKSILKSESVKNPEDIADKIIEKSKAKSLIEYSRAIHAEMDAITTLARSNNGSSLDKIMYCTTYPCHICARHIVAAGIKKVVYIEPYEKSLAIELHSDAICHPETQSSSNKVLFVNFEGVSPKRYLKFFGYNNPRKNSDGKVITRFGNTSGQVDPQHLDGYNDYEKKVINNLSERFPENVE